MTEPVDCNVPRCTNPSIFTEHGMVGGNDCPVLNGDDFTPADRLTVIDGAA